MRTSFLLFAALVISRASFAQQADSVNSVYSSGTVQNYLKAVDHKISSAEEKITGTTEKYLKKFQKQESKISKQLARVDSSVVGSFTNASAKYKSFAEKTKSKTAGIRKVGGGEYDAYLDSLGTSLRFLKQFKTIGDKVKDPLKDVQQLESKLQQAEQVKAFIAQRKEQIKLLVSKYTNLPSGLKKQYAQLSKTAYYYSAQLKEYKDMLKDEKKVEQKALSLLNKMPAFQQFMKENSQLASMFGIPGSSSNTGTQALAGLQTRASVQAMISQQISAGGPNAQAQIQQNLAQAHAEINKIKEQVNKLGGSGDITMPDFKPNEQKTKSFLRRLEYGGNLQSQKSSNYFPATTDVGLSVGYKLNNKSVIGIGASYKVGLGRGWNHISISSEGVGLRSFVDYKIKKSFFLSGGYEQNYKAAFNTIDQLKNYSAWQTSGLIGISKKYQISKKFKGNMQLLWDFLSYQQIPRTQAIVYRVGYNLK